MSSFQCFGFAAFSVVITIHWRFGLRTCPLVKCVQGQNKRFFCFRLQTTFNTIYCFEVEALSKVENVCFYGLLFIVSASAPQVQNNKFKITFTEKRKFFCCYFSFLYYSILIKFNFTFKQMIPIDNTIKDCPIK